MKQKLKSLQIHMLLPVIVMTLFVVTMLTTLFSHAYISMIMQREQEANAVGFDTVSRSITPLVETSIGEVQNIIADNRISSYARHLYASEEKMIHARID